jgi:lipoate-protein ligase A
MAVDAAILRGVESGDSPPTLRLYGWTPWCVTLGHFQDPAQELDPEALRARGWDVVLRPTGGRAVLHAEEITYSILARRDEAPWCATLGESYGHIGRAWAAALRGFDLDLVKGQTLEKPERGVVAAPCFASSARSELAFEGRKVVGSAQRRTRAAFVQHGSIPVTADHERLVEVLRLDAARKEAYLRVLRRHAVSLGEITAIPGEGERAAWERRLAESLLEALGVAGAAGELTAEEMAFTAAREAEHEERQKGFLGTSYRLPPADS